MQNLNRIRDTSFNNEDPVRALVTAWLNRNHLEDFGMREVFGGYINKILRLLYRISDVFGPP